MTEISWEDIILTESWKDVKIAMFMCTPIDLSGLGGDFERYANKRIKEEENGNDQV